MQATVVLTGSTGNLGCYLLDRLAASHQNVRHVVCLNRTQDALSRQQQQLKDRGLTVSSLTTSDRETGHRPKISFYKCDLSQPGLGLAEDVYELLLSDTTHIIHCAWPVDWNKSFASFKNTVCGVSNLATFARSAQRKPRFVFISSQAVVGNWGAISGAQPKVPEREIDDWKVARFGYGQSKLVAERLLAEAHRAHNLDVAICRVGQVAGPVKIGTSGSKSEWPRQEWLPSLVISSKYLGLLPESLASLDEITWIPVDILASTICELSLNRKPGEKSIEYNHVVNPKSVRWSTLLPTLHQALGSNIKLVDLPAWVDALERSAHTTSIDEMSQNPAIKLLSFFDELRDRAIHLPKARAPTLEVRETRQRSSTLSTMRPVDPGWMHLWMQQWGYDT